MAKQEKVFSLFSPHKHFKTILRKYNLHMYLKIMLYIYIYIQHLLKPYNFLTKKLYSSFKILKNFILAIGRRSSLQKMISIVTLPLASLVFPTVKIIILRLGKSAKRHAEPLPVLNQFFFKTNFPQKYGETQRSHS